MKSYVPNAAQNVLCHPVAGLCARRGTGQIIGPATRARIAGGGFTPMTAPGVAPKGALEWCQGSVRLNRGDSG
jgi:hypothetical protein